jgi:hypothetical protein
MKFNWGNGLFVVIILFIIVLFVLVYKATRQKIDLVSKDYYPRELRYDEVVEKKKNAAALGDDISVEQLNSGLRITLPGKLKNEFPEGVFHLYRASDEKLDIRDTIPPDSTMQFIIPASLLKKGKYELYVDLKDRDRKGYLFHKTVVVN